MRPSCPDCARKHLGQAAALLNESVQGYPDHLWLAMGHLAEAADELVQDYPSEATVMRGVRLKLEQGSKADLAAAVKSVNIPALIGLVTRAAGGAPSPAPQPPRPGKPSGVPMTPEQRKEVERLRAEQRGARAHQPAPLAATVNPKGYDAATAAVGTCWGCAKNEWSKVRESLRAKMSAERAMFLPDSEGPTPGGRPPVYLGRLVILTTLADFNPSYSLTTVIIQQAHAAAMVGLRVTILVHKGCNVSLLPPLPRQIEVLDIVPHSVWKEDQINDKDVVIIKERLRDYLGDLRELTPHLAPGQEWSAHGYGSISVITHDLLFQSWFVTFAKAIHELMEYDTERAGRETTFEGPLAGISWFHLCHSSVNGRPQEADGLFDTLDPETMQEGTKHHPSWYRCTLPHGHKLLVLNEDDAKHFREAYWMVIKKNADGGYLQRALTLPEWVDSVKVLHNPHDYRSFLRMTPQAAIIATRAKLIWRDIVQLYPISCTRVREKGVHQVLELFGAMKKQGYSVCLVLALAHANGSDAADYITWIKEHAALCGLNGGTDCELIPPSSEPDTLPKLDARGQPVAGSLSAEVVLSCEVLPETAGPGLDGDTIRSLWQVSNLFAFPTISEAGSLVLMEAAMAGCQLALNDSLPGLKDYVDEMEGATRATSQGVVWVPWGSDKGQGDPSFKLDPLADDVANRVLAQDLRRGAYRKHCLEVHAQDLINVLGLPVVGFPPL